MLELYRAGYIKMPPKKCSPHNPLAKPAKPAEIAIDKTPIVAILKDIGALEFKQVRRSQEEKLFNNLISQYHNSEALIRKGRIDIGYIALWAYIMTIW